MSQKNKRVFGCACPDVAVLHDTHKPYCPVYKPLKREQKAIDLSREGWGNQ